MLKDESTTKISYFAEMLGRCLYLIFVDVESANDNNCFTAILNHLSNRPIIIDSSIYILVKRSYILDLNIK